MLQETKNALKRVKTMTPYVIKMHSTKKDAALYLIGLLTLQISPKAQEEFIQHIESSY